MELPSPPTSPTDVQICWSLLTRVTTRSILAAVGGSGLLKRRVVDLCVQRSLGAHVAAVRDRRRAVLRAAIRLHRARHRPGFLEGRWQGRRRGRGRTHSNGAPSCVSNQRAQGLCVQPACTALAALQRPARQPRPQRARSRRAAPSHTRRSRMRGCPATAPGGCKQEHQRFLLSQVRCDRRQTDGPARFYFPNLAASTTMSRCASSGGRGCPSDGGTVDSKSYRLYTGRCHHI
jgi:hypothetical protein